VLSLDFLTEESVSHERQDFQKSILYDETMYDERKEIILDALQLLSNEYRHILILREYEDLSYEEISATLGISLQAVKSRLFRARTELKKYLKDYFKELV
jgi:RNA polymerase sigma-70 factor (ECF subfamily)